MIDINLLPWREARRHHHRRRWYAMLLLSLLVGAGVAVGIERLGAMQLKAQQQRVALIEQHIADLAPDLARMETLKARGLMLEQQLMVRQALFDQHGDVLRMLNGLVDTGVEGVSYLTLQQRGRQLLLEGRAASHRHIAKQLQSLEASDVFQAPSLARVEPREEGWHFRLGVLQREPLP